LFDRRWPSTYSLDVEDRRENEHTLLHALSVLEQHGFVQAERDGDERHRYEWQYELTPAGLVEVQKVQAEQKGWVTWVQAMGTDGRVRRASSVNPLGGND